MRCGVGWWLHIAGQHRNRWRGRSNRSPAGSGIPRRGRVWWHPVRREALPGSGRRGRAGHVNELRRRRHGLHGLRGCSETAHLRQQQGRTRRHDELGLGRRGHLRRPWGKSGRRGCADLHNPGAAGAANGRAVRKQLERQRHAGQAAGLADLAVHCLAPRRPHEAARRGPPPHACRQRHAAGARRRGAPGAALPTLRGHDALPAALGGHNAETAGQRDAAAGAVDHGPQGRDGVDARGRGRRLGDGVNARRLRGSGPGRRLDVALLRGHRRLDANGNRLLVSVREGQQLLLPTEFFTRRAIQVRRVRL
mmetsp:Transcript_8460/g.24328  ORF Transcript_8460/g.24328 Transcript_8460/m.24328 type:complete len:308 (+) Transcript_8460:318-1241(+)